MSAPLVPVTVKEYVPGAVACDVRIRSCELVPVVDAGFSWAVHPAGRPVTLSATDALNPPVRVIEIVYCALPPAFVVTDCGLSESEKSLGGFTTSVPVTVCVSVPLAPVTVNVEEPAGVVADVAMTSVEVVAAGFGVNVAVAPAGRPDAESVTSPAKPPVRVMLTV
jgi:hypothetical protein